MGYLIDEKKVKSQTVKSYISDIKGVLAEDRIMLNRDRFLLLALTSACKIKNNKVRTRLPLTKGILDQVIKQTEEYFVGSNQYYLSVLYSTLFMITYFGMFRVSKVTMGEHPIRACDVKIANNKQKMMFILRTSKTHGRHNKPQKVKIMAVPTQISKM